MAWPLKGGGRGKRASLLPSLENLYRKEEGEKEKERETEAEKGKKSLLREAIVLLLASKEGGEPSSLHCRWRRRWFLPRGTTVALANGEKGEENPNCIERRKRRQTDSGGIKILRTPFRNPCCGKEKKTLYRDFRASVKQGFSPCN